MNKQKKVILIVIILAMLLMIVAYANLSNQNLYVKGSATASAVQDNFKIQFTGENTTVSNATNVTVGSPKTPANATANSQISVDFSNLTAAEDTDYAILEIKNNSNGIEAEKVIVTTHGGDIENWITIDAVMCDANGNAVTNPETETALAVGDVIYVKVTATLLQTITGEEKEATIDVVLEATPKLNEKTYSITWTGDGVNYITSDKPTSIEEGGVVEVEFSTSLTDTSVTVDCDGAEYEIVGYTYNGTIRIFNPSQEAEEIVVTVNVASGGASSEPT